MKGDGNNIPTFWRKLRFLLIPTSRQRTSYIYNHKDLFHHIGKNLKFQPRQFPSDPEYISLGNNVRIASGVKFITHDIISEMLNIKYNSQDFKILWGAISVGNNVMIGSSSIILPNVRIGDNVIIGAGSIISRDIPDNSIVAGVPAKVVGNFDDYVDKRKKLNDTQPDTVEEVWKEFNSKRKLL